jgi:hypothetical protein
VSLTEKIELRIKREFRINNKIEIKEMIKIMAKIIITVIKINKRENKVMIIHT